MICMYVCMSVCLFVGLSVCLFIYLFIYLFTQLFIYLLIYLLIYLFINQSEIWQGRGSLSCAKFDSNRWREWICEPQISKCDKISSFSPNPAGATWCTGHREMWPWKHATRSLLCAISPQSVKEGRCRSPQNSKFGMCCSGRFCNDSTMLTIFSYHFLLFNVWFLYSMLSSCVRLSVWLSSVRHTPVLYQND